MKSISLAAIQSIALLMVTFGSVAASVLPITAPLAPFVCTDDRGLKYGVSFQKTQLPSGSVYVNSLLGKFSGTFKRGKHPANTRLTGYDQIHIQVKEHIANPSLAGAPAKITFLSLSLSGIKELGTNRWRGFGAGLVKQVNYMDGTVSETTVTLDCDEPAGMLKPPPNNCKNSRVCI